MTMWSWRKFVKKISYIAWEIKKKKVLLIKPGQNPEMNTETTYMGQMSFQENKF